MGLKERIPFTQARRDRLFAEILHKRAAGKDGLALIEWEDGSLTMEPVGWDNDNSAIVDEKGNRFFARGLGSEPKDLAGVPIWYVFAGNAGIISTEAALLADAEEHQDGVYDLAAGDELPDDLIAEGVRDPNTGRGPSDVLDAEPLDADVVETARAIQRGELKAVDANALLAREVQENGDRSGLLSRLLSAFGGDDGKEVRTDGGVAQEPGRQPRQQPAGGQRQADDGDDPPVVYDLRPPEGYQGVAISVRQPDYYDPNPVTRADAKAAQEWAQQAEGRGKDQWMYGFIVGLLVFAGIWFLMTVVPWLLAQIGGAGGGGGQVITGSLLAAGGPTGLRGCYHRLRAAL